MAAASLPSPRYDLEGAASYIPIPAGPGAAPAHSPPRRKLLAAVLFSSFLLISTVLFLTTQNESQVKLTNAGVETAAPSHVRSPLSRGPAKGVSEKVFRRVGGGGLTFPWNNAMLTWQRTAFHFQPEQNWMNGKFFKFLFNLSFCFYFHRFRRRGAFRSGQSQYPFTKQFLFNIKHDLTLCFLICWWKPQLLLGFILSGDIFTDPNGKPFQNSPIILVYRNASLDLFIFLFHN